MEQAQKAEAAKKAAAARAALEQAQKAEAEQKAAAERAALQEQAQKAEAEQKAAAARAALEQTQKAEADRAALEQQQKAQAEQAAQAQARHELLQQAELMIQQAQKDGANRAAKEVQLELDQEAEQQLRERASHATVEADQHRLTAERLAREAEEARQTYLDATKKAEAAIKARVDKSLEVEQAQQEAAERAPTRAQVDQTAQQTLVTPDTSAALAAKNPAVLSTPKAARPSRAKKDKDDFELPVLSEAEQSKYKNFWYCGDYDDDYEPDHIHCWYCGDYGNDSRYRRSHSRTATSPTFAGNGLALEAVLRFKRQQEEEQKDEGELIKLISDSIAGMADARISSEARVAQPKKKAKSKGAPPEKVLCGHLEWELLESVRIISRKGETDWVKFWSDAQSESWGRTHPVQSWDEASRATAYGVTIHGDEGQGKGDWKWRVEWLRQVRYYNNKQILGPTAGLCPRCLCTRDTWLDVHERFNAPADLATARLTAVGDIALKSLPGWEPEMEVPDLLHTLWTGTGRDLIGSLCLHSIETSASYTGSTYDERLRQLRRDMQAWCMEHGIRPSTVEELSLSRLCVETLSLDYPLGPSKGYANKVLTAYFAERLQATRSGRLYVQCYIKLAEEALQNSRALQLGDKAEKYELVTLKLEVIKKEEQRDWLELLREFACSGTKTLLLKAILTSPITRDLPAEVQTKLVQGFDPKEGEAYLKALPLSRRKRKALLASRSWVVHLFSGGEHYKNDPFETIPAAGKVVLEIDKDVSKLWDLNRSDGVYQLLLWAACTGRIADIVGSPPHGSWPTSQSPKHGPEAYALRTSDEPYGIQDLTAFQKQRVDEETVHVAKQLVVWMLAQMCGKRNVGFLLEAPAVEERISKKKPEGVSIWTTEMWKNFGSISGIKEFSFYMGAFGHKAKRPTTIATTYPSVNQIDYNQGVTDDCVPATLLSNAELRRWPRSFKEFVAEAIKDYHAGSWKEEEEMLRAGVRMSKLTKEQREAWHRHLFNDHQPYRADCAVCINAQATGYQHRRRRHPSMYTMALDLAGPFKSKGRDMDHDDYKYIMVAAYRCPREYMSEKAAAELDKNLYVPDEETEVEGEDPMEVIGEAGGGREAGEPEPSEEEKEEVPLGPETMDEAVEGLARPDEWATIYITRPLRGRTNHYVVQAAKEILLQLRQSGLHVGMVHTDRAREFRAKAFKEWTVDSQLRHTKTAGADPAGNSSAEIGIKWAKARVRALLTASGAPQRDWPMAIQHASSDLWARTFPDSPWTSPPATAFGNEVWFRSKAYQGKKEKKHEAAGSRWKKGWYRGPAVDVKRGHLIVREDGGLTVAKSVKFGVWEPNKDLKGILSPAIAEGLPEEERIVDEPPTREELKDEIEFRARKLLEEENFSLEEIVDLYKLLELRGDSDTRLGRKTQITSWYTGAYVHGGVAGARANLREFPYATRYLVKAAKHYCGEIKFSALGVAKNAQLGLHRDSRNYGLSKNYVLPLVEVEGGSLWIQDEEVDESSMVSKVLENGKVVRGRCLEFKKGCPMEFSPREWHEVQPWVGERLVLLMYTPRATKLSAESVEALQEVGFEIDPQSLVPTEGDLQDDDPPGEALQDLPSTMVTMIQVQPDSDEESYAFVEIEENEVFQEGGPHNPELYLRQAPVQEKVKATATKVIKKAEVQYTAGIEDLLQDLKKDGKPLEVTHNVSLQDVRKNITAWKESALKEFTNLTEAKKAFRVVKRRRGLRSLCDGGGRYFTTDLGLAAPGDMWYVEQAIYGLRESPALWSQFRDEQMRMARWTMEVDGEKVTMMIDQMITDNQIWKIVREDQPQGEVYGYIMVYIDDLLIHAPEQAMYGFFQWVSTKWEVDALDILDYDHPIRFLGMELHRVKTGIELSQEGFIGEILRAHHHKGGRSHSQGPKETLLLSDEEEQALIQAEPTQRDPKDPAVKEAQRRVGELLWLMGRTRPDIQHTVSIMAARLLRCPEMVNKIGERLLDYLNETKHYRLAFTQNEEDIVDGLDIFTDSSFAPSGGRSQGAAAVFYGNNPLVWRSGRQQLTTLSTAESELVESVEGTLLGLSTRGLLTELLGEELHMTLWVDNSAAEEKAWLWKLVLLCQVCGVKAREHELQAEVPWDLLLAVLVLGVAVIGKITRNELKELQCLLQLDPERLSVQEKERLLDLREKFNETRQTYENVPTIPREEEYGFPVAADVFTSMASCVADGSMSFSD
ncbi:RE1, partial [Symbiodinium microadriaticum]